jgi:hypothetical protein
MWQLCLLTMMVAFPGQGARARTESQDVVDTIEALQQPVEDFRCEFEGTNRYMGAVAESVKVVREDGLYESFSGIFVWRAGGDIYTEFLNRRMADNQISRENLAVRVRKGEAEEYHRMDDSPIGIAVIRSLKEVRPSFHNCLSSIFLVDLMKREIADDRFETTVTNDQIDGTPVRVLNVALKGVPVDGGRSQLLARYWVDLRRSGHVVRTEGYRRGEVVRSRLNVKLAPFQVGGTEVWMPVSGEKFGYEALVDKKLVITKEPTSIMRIYVVGGTMEFNKRPGAEVFTMKYKPGTPISDELRKLTYEFGQQKIAARPTKADTEKMLDEQLARAEEQRNELVVASTDEGFDWASLMIWVFAGLTVIGSAALLIQRRKR